MAIHRTCDGVRRREFLRVAVGSNSPRNSAGASLQFPCHAAVVAKELGGVEDLPSSVAIPISRHGAGYLGVRYAAFGTGDGRSSTPPSSLATTAAWQGNCSDAIGRLPVCT